MSALNLLQRINSQILCFYYTKWMLINPYNCCLFKKQNKKQWSFNGTKNMCVMYILYLDVFKCSCYCCCFLWMFFFFPSSFTWTSLPFIPSVLTFTPHEAAHALHVSCYRQAVYRTLTGKCSLQPGPAVIDNTLVCIHRT